MVIFMLKTNAMRILDEHKIKYETLEYAHKEKEFINGSEVANLLNKNPENVFKTLVGVSKTKKYYVFMIPVLENLDLKKASKAVGEKSISMLPLKDLTNVTGYIRGGCSPIGMKHSYKTIIDISSLMAEEIVFSAGKIGYQIVMSPHDLAKVIDCDFKNIIQ